MNIVCYINKISLGGAERVMSVLANGLSKRGHKVTLVIDYSMTDEYLLNPQINKIVLDGDYNKTKIKNPFVRTVSRIKKIREICKKENADILVSFIKEANERAILATRGLKTKNLISVRVDPKVGYQSLIEKIIACYLYRYADGCVFQTEEAKAFYSKTIQNKSAIIYNPVSSSFYQVTGRPGSRKQIVSCGRLARQKNYELLIRAFAEVHKKHIDYELHIYGTGQLQKELEKLIVDLGMDSKVILKGRCNNIPDAIKDASLFVLSSDYEGLPNALMEAMALGLPVISTDCSGGGARLLIRNGNNGYIVPCNDIEKLSKRINYCLENYDNSLICGQNAKIDAKKYSEENIVMEWEKYLYRILKKDYN